MLDAWRFFRCDIDEEEDATPEAALRPTEREVHGETVHRRWGSGEVRRSRVPWCGALSRRPGGHNPRLPASSLARPTAVVLSLDGQKRHHARMVHFSIFAN